MAIPKFEDKNDYDVATVYRYTNEEPEIFRNLLKRMRFGKSAAIASGGEIALLVMLMRCEEVVAIDHSRSSLACAMTKAMLMDVVGASKLRKLLINREYAQIMEHAKNVRTKLPEQLAKAKGGTLTNEDLKGMRREWYYAASKLPDNLAAKLDKLTFVHGDLTDLAQYGKFQMLYISNAMEHTGRVGKPTLNTFLPIVEEGGYMLATVSGETKPTVTNGWEIVRSIMGFRTSWNHILFRRLADAPVVTTPVMGPVLATS